MLFRSQTDPGLVTFCDVRPGSDLGLVFQIESQHKAGRLMILRVWGCPKNIRSLRINEKSKQKTANPGSPGTMIVKWRQVELGAIPPLCDNSYFSHTCFCHQSATANSTVILCSNLVGSPSVYRQVYDWRHLCTNCLETQISSSPNTCFTTAQTSSF